MMEEFKKALGHSFGSFVGTVAAVAVVGTVLKAVSPNEKKEETKQEQEEN